MIVPVYNREHLIERCLDSISCQQSLPATLIVVDNNSSDTTPQVVERWIYRNRHLPMEVQLIQESRPGAAIARQTGFEHSTTEYVLFFDSDDIMQPDYVARAEAALDGGEDGMEVDMAVWPVRMCHADGRSEITHGVEDDAVHSHMVHSLLRTQGYACRRSLMERAGGWNPRLRGWDDWELGVRLLLQHPRIVEVSIPLADVYVHPDSITGRDFSSKEGEWELALLEAERAIYHSGHAEAHRLSNYIHYRRVILAALYDREGNHAASSRLRHLTARYHDTLSLPQRLFLKMVYRYTRAGQRGAGRAAKYLF